MQAPKLDLALRHGPNDAQNATESSPQRDNVAKPLTGEIDYAELRKKVMTRFRKTLAYLAK